MPMPGYFNSPVCWANGSGQDPSYPDIAVPSRQLQCVAPWMYPWQTPIGVMQTEATGKTEIQIQVSGEFRVPRAGVFPTFVDAELSDMLNRRVYYDADSGKYIVQDVFKVAGFDPRALFPGSATIGYISDVDLADEEIGITIDPRPPTATYAVALASTSSSWSLGMTVAIDPDTNIISFAPSAEAGTLGVVAGWLKDSLVPPPGNIPMIIVTRGIAWVHHNSQNLYNLHDRDDLLACPSTSIPIDLIGEACSLGVGDYPIIGTISLNEWYDPDEQSFPGYVLMDVKGGELA